MKDQSIIDYWSSVKEIIDKICGNYDALWQARSRILNSKIVVMMIFKIILSDRRQGLTVNLTEFRDSCEEKAIELPQKNLYPHLPFVRLVKKYVKIFLKILVSVY